MTELKVTPFSKNFSSNYRYSDVFGPPPEKKFKDKVYDIYYSKPVQLFSFICIFYALFAEEFKYLFCSISADPAFSGVSIFLLCYFFCELLLTCYLNQNYLWSFDFFIDFLAAGSLIIDINGLYDDIISSNDATVVSADTTKYGRVIKLDSRSARILRFVRFFRIGKVLSALRIRQPVELEDHPSMVGDLLTEKIIRRLLVCIIAMIIILPFCDTLLYVETINDEYSGVGDIHYLSQMDNIDKYERCDMISTFHKNHDTLLSFQLCGNCIYSNLSECGLVLDYKDEGEIRDAFRFSEYMEVRVDSIYLHILHKLFIFTLFLFV